MSNYRGGMAVKFLKQLSAIVLSFIIILGLQYSIQLIHIPNEHCFRRFQRLHIRQTVRLIPDNQAPLPVLP